MDFTLTKTLEILQQTPKTLNTMLGNLSNDWVKNNEGKDTWSAYDVVGHLIHGEKTDWVPRLKMILSDKEDKTFEPFDRFAQFEVSKGKTLADLLKEFELLRIENISFLNTHKTSIENQTKKGIHPAFGEVNINQLLATWAVHDLNHISQIARVMAKQYEKEVGPWISYLKILS